MEGESEREIKRRRHYSAEFKAQVMSACSEPGASVAATALAYGMNANLLHEWRRKARRAQEGEPASEFIAIAVPAAAERGAAERPLEPIEVHLRRGATQVHVRWPAEASQGCAAWLAELLR